ncbi:MAG: cell division protein ZapE, partial [Natronospirillum sp.]
LEQAALFHTPANSAAEEALLNQFNSIAPDVHKCEVDGQLDILGRQIHYKRECEDIVWFDFAALCDGPRSAHDYIEIARCYHAVVISDVPRFTGANEDAARRFITLVDEFYDRRVKLLLSSEVPILELYLKGQRRFEFERTESRLLEMQSHDYLAAAHKA